MTENAQSQNATTSGTSTPYKTPSTLKMIPPNPYNIEAPKEFSFNETGNIMVASTKIKGGEIESEVQQVFQEVSVFFAAMTKALAIAGDSLYDMEAVRKVIDQSGMFVHVTEEQVSASYSQFSGNMSKELIEALLGLASGTGEMGFAAAMVKSIGSHGLNVSGGHSSSSNKVGNIVFVCEYILGMAVVSAIVVYCDVTENETWFKIGPCVSGKAVSETLKMTKDTFMFVVPSAIKKFGGDLAGVESDTEYQTLIRELVGYLDPGAMPPVFGEVSVGGNKAPTAVTELKKDTNYQLIGQHFGEPDGGALAFEGEKPGTSSITIVNWTDSNIVFSLNDKAEVNAPGKHINLYPDADAVTNDKASGATPGAYTVS